MLLIMRTPYQIICGHMIRMMCGVTTKDLEVLIGPIPILEINSFQYELNLDDDSEYISRILVYTWFARRDINRTCICIICRIKTGHSNLVSCFGPRIRVLAKVFYRGEADTHSHPSTHISIANNPRLFTIAEAISFCRSRQCTPSPRWMHAPGA